MLSKSKNPYITRYRSTQVAIKTFEDTKNKGHKN